MTRPQILRWLVALGLATAPRALPAQDTAHVVIVSTTDIHGHISGWDFIEGRPFPGGLSRAGTVVDSLRARYPGQVVLVDAGDVLAGDPFDTYFATHPRTPHPALEIMDAMEYDAIVPGNHEFNYGFEYFQQSYRGQNLRPVCANCVLPGAGYNGADSLMFAPYITVPRGRVRVAIAGLTTPGSMVWDGEHLRGKLQVRPVGDRSTLFRTMRTEADLVVALIHSGMDGAASYDTTGVGDENVAASLALGTSKPDVVVVGHSHREM
ncbi:MAG TPA: metallophosphoesterase, partial [Gemmatimonadales bacterium]|nr:metallophosphoesterase [Gemmatimonadales bacterium]